MIVAGPPSVSTQARQTSRSKFPSALRSRSLTVFLFFFPRIQLQLSLSLFFFVLST